MMDFKKRALILTLAATISVTGSFAADNYKNCLMDMEFKALGTNEIGIVLNTKKPCTETIVPIKKDASTYVIMLPEMDNQASTPNLSDAAGSIESVEVRKMPYSDGHKGYTKILIRTSGQINLNASTALYVPSKELPEITQKHNRDELDRERQEVQENKRQSGNNFTTKNAYKNGKIENPKTDSSSDISAEKHKINEYSAVGSETSEQDNEAFTSDNSSADLANVVTSENNTYQQYMLGLLVIFIIITSIYFYIKAQDKLTNVMGEKLQIDVDENAKDEQEKNKKKSKISKTINKLDDIYSKSASKSINAILSSKDSGTVKQEEDSQEELNIVDLDALFKEKQSEKTNDTDISSYESDALDDFLSGFSFDDSEIKPPEEDENSIGFDEEAYEQLLSSKGIVFSKADIACFNELMASEISDTVMNDINKYTVSNPIANNKPSKEGMLEKIVTDYTVFQNITFNSDDIDILKKLISVELDPDFISDLRTNPNRTSEMEKEINAPKTERKKPSEILTLNVKDLLPNLSEALRKQGNRPIKSEVKPETVYFNEGYEVSTLSTDFDLPNLAKEIKNRKSQVSVPSAEVQTVDYSYSDSVQKLSITGLPDLKDVVAHPEKYKEEEPEVYVADENALLNSIMNVKFKPFDDGTREFEIINNDIEDSPEENSPSIEDIRNEFNQFENFHVADTDNANDVDNNYDENNSDEPKDHLSETPEENNNYSDQTMPVKTEDNSLENLNLTRQKPPKRTNKQKSTELINMIEIMKAERNKKRQLLSESKDKKPATENINTTTKSSSIVKCIIDGTNYDIIDSASITENIGFYLAKYNNGYAVLAYKDSEITKIKEYVSLRSEKIILRKNYGLDDKNPQYLIRIGANKFIAEINNEKIKYVMDL